MPILTFNIDQGSADWSQMRSVIPTASEFDQIMTPKKMELAAGRKKYACRIIAARMLNWQPDSLDKITHIEQGKAKEPLAIAMLEEMHGIETKKVGFVTTNDRRFGASPDRIVLKNNRVDITVESKCPTIPTQFQYLLYGHDDAYQVQVQGQMLVCENEHAIFQSFHERTPPFTVRTDRNEAMIRKLAACLDQFSDELETLHEKAKSLGDYIEFERWLTPAERDLAPTDSDIQSALDADYQWGA